MTVVDYMTGILTYLKADAGVAAQVGTRVYGEEVPDGEVNSMPRKALLVQSTVGGFPPRGYGQYNRRGIDIRCYGDGYVEAFAVYRAAYEALKYMERNTQGAAMLYKAWEAGSPMALREPVGEPGWPMYLQSWTVMVADVATA